MNKLLVICGPTATGKTSLALHLAKVFDGELVSADSRQVYRGMDIGTGKDIGEIGNVPLWGVDLVDPKNEFHVQEYVSIVQRMIRDIWKRNKLPIVVGGTGFYIKALIDGIPTLKIPRNDILRKRLIAESVDNMYKTLSVLDPLRAASLNASDRRNPRRIIRAIEIATWKLENKNFEEKKSVFENVDVVKIGLFGSKETLRTNISRRTEKMFKEGIVKEIQNLLSKGVTWNSQSMKAIGYYEWKEYFDGKKNSDDILIKWKTDEEKYAKRQMTWFRKDHSIAWYDIESKKLLIDLEKLVKKWYTLPNAKS